MPGATVAAPAHRSAWSTPKSKARAIGAQPAAWTTTIFGRFGPISPIASSSANAFHMPTMPVPPPVG
jgi:hypothetical protein